MNSQFDSTELHSLFAQFLDGTIGSKEQDRLESVLLQDDQARKLWFLFCDVESGLQDWSVTQDEARSLEIPFQKKIVSSRRMPAASLVLLAATLLIAITLAFWFARQPVQPRNNEIAQTENPVSEVAVLTHVAHAVWQDDNVSLPAGATLTPSGLQLRSGALLIEYFSGATIVLEGPAEYEILSRNAGRLVSGKLNAHVPPQAKGFTIKTSVGEIIDHGTDFGVEMTAGKPHELHVFNGVVEVKSDNASRTVKSGEAVRLGMEAAESFDADRSLFLNEEDLIQQSRVASARRLDQWRKASSALSNDPSVLYHLRLDHPNDANVGELELENSAGNSESGTGGTLVGGQQVAGRWHGKWGVLFGGPADRIRFSVSQPMEAVTLLAWVNVQSLSRWQNSLISADSDVPGSIHWQLTKRGQLRMAIARDLGRDMPDWEAVESEPFVTEKQLRRWMLLATTFDGTTVRHYANGRLIGTGASFTPEALHLGTAEIGNWHGKTRRELHAIMDECAVLSRVLREEEIAEIYRYGKP